MRFIINAACLMLIFCLAEVSVQGQNYMYLNEELKVASQPFTAKRKGISAIGKYEFGPYRIIAGKEGWTRTREKSGFFSGDSRIQSDTKKTFVLTGNETDTVHVNITITSVAQIDELYGFVFRSLTNWSDKIVTESSETFIASIETPYDTALWNLILIYPVSQEIEGTIQKEQLDLFNGVLTNGQKRFDIVPEFRWENGKPASLLKPLEGYQFLMNEEAWSAVQVFPLNKNFVWIRNDLGDDLKLLFAAAAAVLLVRAN